MLNKETLKEVIREYHKPVITGLIAFLLGYFINKNGGYIILGSGSNVNIEMTQHNEDLESPDSTDVNEVNFFPREPIFLAIHCTGSLYDQTKADLWKIFYERWGSNCKPGYNYAINKKGEIYTFAPIDNSSRLEWNEIVNGVKGKNSITISIAIIGNRDKNEITNEQIIVLKALIMHFKIQFPNIRLITHRDLGAMDNKGHIDSKNWKKVCPRFNLEDYNLF